MRGSNSPPPSGVRSRPRDQTGFTSRTGHAQKRDLRRVDDRRERGPTDPPQTRNRKAGSLHLIGREPASPRDLRELRGLAGELDQALAADVANYRNNQTVLSVDRDPEMMRLLQDEVFAIGLQGSSRTRDSCRSASTTAFITNTSGESFTPFGGQRIPPTLPERFEQRDVRLVVLGHMRQVQPAACSGSGRLAGESSRAAPPRSRRSARSRPCGPAGIPPPEPASTEPTWLFRSDTRTRPCGPDPCASETSTPHSRATFRTSGLACTGPTCGENLARLHRR